MVNDYFNGSIMSVVNADKFAIAHIEPSVLKEDQNMMDLKFWDYKMWHPTVATMYFVHRYHTIAAEVIEREVGAEEARKYRIKASKYDLSKQKLQVIRGFWKARMTADGIGCTYDSYIRAIITNFRANKYKFATAKMRLQHLPYATQMSGEIMMEVGLRAWKEEKIKRFPLPQSEDIPNNAELWFRPEMEAWLREEASKHEFGAHYLRKAQSTGIILTN